MGKKKLAALMAVLVVSALAACGRIEETADMGEADSSEESSADLLVGTLEYLLNEEGEADEGKALLQIKDDEPKQPDNKEVSNQIEATIYYGNGASDKLNTEMEAMDELTAQNLVDALAGHNILSLGTKVNSFEEGEEEGIKVLYLDLDKAFREYLKTMNSDSEKVILASVTATFLEAYAAERIVITVEGKTLETNYKTYDEPFGYNREYIEALPQNK